MLLNTQQVENFIISYIFSYLVVQQNLSSLRFCVVMYIFLYSSFLDCVSGSYPLVHNKHPLSLPQPPSHPLRMMTVLTESKVPYIVVL